MARTPRHDPKLEALREQAVLNKRSGRVRDQLFVEHEFFDARDLVQVKYEMVRRVQTDGASVSEAAEAFGFSRPSFYQAQESLREHGLAGLLPKKRGPRSAHKLSAEVIEYVEHIRAQEPSVTAQQLADHIGRRFGIRVHRRSVERALDRMKKKRPVTHCIVDASGAVAGYERLRSSVSGERVQEPGLGVLMRRGVRAWLEARAEAATSAQASAAGAGAGACGSEAATETRVELARLIAAMVISAATMEVRS